MLGSMGLSVSSLHDITDTLQLLKLLCSYPDVYLI